MNPLVTYAKIVMSFMNLYRRRRSQGNHAVAITFAMSGILVVNVWSLLLLVSLVDRGWLAERSRLSAGEFAGLLLGILVVELTLVNFVQNKAARDAGFAARVGTPPPNISIWYAGISAALLAVSTLLVVV